LKQRIVTGVIAAIAFLSLLVLGGYWYSGLILIMAIIGYYEYIRMFGLLNHKFASLIGYILLLWIAIPWEVKEFDIGLPMNNNVIWIAMFLLLAVNVVSKNRFVIDQAAALFLGAIYIGYGFHYMISIRLLESGLFYTLLVFVCVWLSDAGAYFVGVKFGKHPLWPTISPKKSIEGSIGGVVTAIVAAICFALIQPELLSVLQAILIGLIVAVFGQFGDLIQSAYKRVKGIKDTGTILPGHGGVLDRVDSWLIVFPIVHILGLLTLNL